VFSVTWPQPTILNLWPSASLMQKSVFQPQQFFLWFCSALAPLLFLVPWSSENVLLSCLHLPWPFLPGFAGLSSPSHLQVTRVSPFLIPLRGFLAFNTTVFSVRVRRNLGQAWSKSNVPPIQEAEIGRLSI
jgi:hypothetical protein